MPQRIQMSRQVPWRADNPDAVIVSRPSAWGNLFAVGGWWVLVNGKRRPTKFPQFHPEAVKVEDAATAVQYFREYVEDTPELREMMSVLTGHDLACWCPLDQPCHADVLLELANQP